MQHVTTYKFRLYPTKEQEQFLEQQMFGLRKIYNSMVEYIFNDKILFRENVESWIDKRMLDCYGKENARSSTEGRQKYLEKLNKRDWFQIDKDKLTNVATKIKYMLLLHDMPSSPITSMIRNDFSRSIKQIKKDDQIYLEDGQWFIEKFSNKENISIKFPLKTIKGYPKWKTKSERNCYHEDIVTNNISFSNKTGFLKVTKLNVPIKFFVHRDIVSGKILQKKTIIKDIDGCWYICFQVQFEKDEVTYPITKETTVGVDLGQKTHAVSSNGKTLENNKTYQKLLTRKTKLQRIVSNKFETKKLNDAKNQERSEKSKNLKKAQKELAKIEIKIKNIRKNLIDNFTKSIVSDDNVNTIVLENLSVKTMIRKNKDSSKKYKTIIQRSSNKSLHNSAMYMIRSNFVYKSKFLGKNVIIAKQEFPSTQLCSCGAKTGPKGTSMLGVRAWVCESCGRENERDKNASNNLSDLPFRYPGMVDFSESGIEGVRLFGNKPDKYGNR